MTPEEYMQEKNLHGAILEPPMYYWKRVRSAIEEYATQVSAEKDKRIAELEEVNKKILENGKDLEVWSRDYFHLRNVYEEKIRELQAEVERLKGDNKHLNDLLNSALKEKETAEIENERLIKNNS